MTGRAKLGLLCFIFFVFHSMTAVDAQTDLPWSQLSLSTCKIDAYRRTNPKHDGRGIVIAILDTGVEMDVAGLQETSTGEIKVIDVQDFSSQGDVEIKRAIWNDRKDKIVHYADDGSPELFTPPPDGLHPTGTTVWFGLLEEEAFRNSAVPDINDNGKKEDVFGVCVISQDDGTDDDAVCFVDTDGDRDFSNEKPLKNYKLVYDKFTFPRDKKEKQTKPLTIAVNVFVKKRKAIFHFDDGGHGTHVAGIAAGHRIQNQDGFDGVAPGAKIISLKIGHNSLAAGATTTGSKKKAFEYAARYAREHDVTVVCNLSYGIGSNREGHSDIDKFLDKLLRRNPNLIFCTSAGNAGPGLSSVGTPAAAHAVISVGAMLAADTAQDVRAERIADPQLTQFSSRGGELAKPDIAAPGMTTSTVPRWNERGDFYQGTSMASPYAAGMCAILAQRVREAGSIPRADWVKQALMASADPVAGYTTLDYGAGVPDMVLAAEIIDGLSKRRANDPLYAFEVSTNSPLGVEGSGEAAYWRSIYFPIDRPQVFTIKPVFAPTADTTDITGFSKRLTLRSNADWCTTNQEQIYFRSKQSARVEVEYDAGKLKKPGLYVATIEGIEEGGQPLLRLVNSVVVPYRVGPEEGYKLKLENQTVRGWVVRRHFVEVPAGASAMHVTLRAVEGKACTAQMYYIFRPDGHRVGRRYPIRLDTKSDRLESTHTVSKELKPGIWEFPVTSNGTDEISHYSLEVRFDGICAEEPLIADLNTEVGRKPSGKVVLTNAFDRPTIVTTSGLIEGYRKVVNKTLTPDDDRVEVSLSLTSAIRAARIRVEVSDEDYAKFTDCSINVYDEAGNAIAQGGFSGPIATMRADNPDPKAESVTCKLEILPAFTHPNIEDEAEFDIKVDYLYSKSIPIDVKQGERSTATLYPGVPTELSYKLKHRPPEAPEGTSRVGYIRAVERISQKPILEIEINEENSEKD